MDPVEEAVEALRRGTPVLIYDGDEREAEVDMVFHASRVGPDQVYMLRTRAGGLICYATTWEVARGLGLLWGDELISLHEPLRPLTLKRLSYGDRPAFTIWVNYIGVRTGISDRDRSLTIRKLDEVAFTYMRDPGEARKMFLDNFQAPGHVPVLAARSLGERRGHTELSIALARLAGLHPSVAFAEMLDYGDSLPVSKARIISQREGWPLVRGNDIVEACRLEEVCRGS